MNDTVTGSPIPNALFALTVSSLVLEAPTSGTAATGTTTITTNGMPPYGAYVFPTIGSGAALVSATVKSDLDGSATLSLTAKPPASLGSGIYTDNVQLKICYDSACSKPATPTPLKVLVTYVVDASPGVDFTQASIPVEVSDMAWNAARQRIYATANSDTGGISQSLLVINPATASIEQVVSLGQGTDPVSIALSDDGQYAYINDAVVNQILQVNLGTLAVDQAVTIAAIPWHSKPCRVCPPHSQWRAITTTPRCSFMTERPRGLRPSPPVRSKPASPSRSAPTPVPSMPTTIPSHRRPCISCRCRATDSPLRRQTPDIVLNQGDFSDIEYAGGLIYATPGSVYNPATQTLQPSFSFLSSNPEGNSYSYPVRDRRLAEPGLLHDQ